MLGQITPGAQRFRKAYAKQLFKSREVTHKNPKQKTMINRIFWRRGSCSELMSEMGSAKTIKSVVMLIPAAMYQMVRLSIQWLAIEG